MNLATEKDASNLTEYWHTLVNRRFEFTQSNSYF